MARLYGPIPNIGLTGSVLGPVIEAPSLSEAASGVVTRSPEGRDLVNPE
jgi:hypothetical protein